MRHVVICFYICKKIVADYGSNVNFFDILSFHLKDKNRWKNSFFENRWKGLLFVFLLTPFKFFLYSYREFANLTRLLRPAHINQLLFLCKYCLGWEKKHFSTQKTIIDSKNKSRSNNLTFKRYIKPLKNKVVI